MKKEVVLVFPGKHSVRPSLPLSCLFLAKTLEENGYKPKIIDMRVQDYSVPDLRVDDVVCVGISVMTSPMILHGIKFAKEVRELSRDIPIVWGGIHPSLLPDETILCEYVDIVVRGEGELTLLELIQKIESGKSLQDVKGLTYKENGTIKVNPNREWMDLDAIGPLPYHLIDMNKYDTASFSYQSSRGCPHNCGFCYNRAFNKKSYRFRSSENVLQDLECIVSQFNPRQINFDDDNFFVNRKRVEEICKGILERNLDIHWYGTCRLDYFSRYDSEFVTLLRDSGCKRILFGAESGSGRILEFVDKDISVEDTICAVKKCKEAGIVPILSFMCGFPDETREDTLMTLDLIDKVEGIYDEALVNGVFLFYPFPNTPLAERLHRWGYRPPSTLEGWGELLFGRAPKHFWLKKRLLAELTVVSDIVRFRHFSRVSSGPRTGFLLNPRSLLRHLLSISARIRWRYRLFRYAGEWRLWSWIRYRRREYA